MSKQYPSRSNHDPCCECGHPQALHKYKYEKPKITGFWKKLKAFWYYQPSIMVYAECEKCYCPQYKFESYKARYCIDD